MRDYVGKPPELRTGFDLNAGGYFRQVLPEAIGNSGSRLAATELQFRLLDSYGAIPHKLGQSNQVKMGPRESNPVKNSPQAPIYHAIAPFVKSVQLHGSCTQSGQESLELASK